MIRMGAENATKIKAKLQEIRRELTGPKGGNPPQPQISTMDSRRRFQLRGIRIGWTNAR